MMKIEPNSLSFWDHAVHGCALRAVVTMQRRFNNCVKDKLISVIHLSDVKPSEQVCTAALSDNRMPKIDKQVLCAAAVAGAGTAAQCSAPPQACTEGASPEAAAVQLHFADDTGLRRLGNLPDSYATPLCHQPLLGATGSNQTSHPSLLGSRRCGSGSSIGSIAHYKGIQRSAD